MVSFVVESDEEKVSYIHGEVRIDVYQNGAILLGHYKLHHVTLLDVSSKPWSEVLRMAREWTKL